MVVNKLKHEIKTSWKMVFIFAILFIFAGQGIPYAYYSYAPVSYFVTINNFYAPDVSVKDRVQPIQTSINTRLDFRAIEIKELTLVRGPNEIVYSYKDNTYYRDINSIVVNYRLPEGLEPGEYYWLVGVEAQFPRGIARNFDLQTNTFMVHE